MSEIYDNLRITDFSDLHSEGIPTNTRITYCMIDQELTKQYTWLENAIT